jgi:hypothetical protein
MIDGFLERNFAGQYLGLSSADRLQFVQALFDVCSVEMGSLGDNNDICSFFTRASARVISCHGANHSVAILISRSCYPCVSDDSIGD